MRILAVFLVAIATNAQCINVLSGNVLATDSVPCGSHLRAGKSVNIHTPISAHPTYPTHFPSGNFSADLIGVLDTRPETWGYTDAVSWSIIFDPPAGYGVLIMGIEGDLTAATKRITPSMPVPGAEAWVLVGFQSTAPSGSLLCNFCADGTPMYDQTRFADGDTGRITIHRDYGDSGFRLQNDNTLNCVVATFLNTITQVTGFAIHAEPTFTITYKFVPKETQQ